MEDKKKNAKGCKNQYRCLNCGAINYAYENEMPERCMKCDCDAFTEMR
ncbi:MAG: hypothetical protein ACOYIQ_03850 [Christensenellales bacterium]|jgi:predicted  nucleic acid-binding Zn-ribbon protein